MIPAYEANGNLPEGIYETSWQEFIDRFGFNDHRNRLIEGLYRALTNLKLAGCTIVYINGSFVTGKSDPEDFDACWQRSGVNLKKLDPVLLDLSNNRTAQKAKYGGELLPDLREDETESDILEFFQLDRDHNRKGIIQIDLGTLP